MVKLKMNGLKVLLLMVTTVSFSGCFQYPDGPFFTVQTRTERINGTWRLTSVTDENGADISSEFQNITLASLVDRSGNSSWSIFQDGYLISFGTFTFAEHGNELIVVYTLLNGGQTDTQEFYSIQKLTDKHFNYIDLNNAELHFDKY